MTSTMKTLAYAMRTAELVALLAKMRAVGYTVKRDHKAGTAIASIDGTEVLRALQTGGRNATWCVRADPRAVAPVPEGGGA